MWRSSLIFGALVGSLVGSLLASALIVGVGVPLLDDGSGRSAKAAVLVTIGLDPVPQVEGATVLASVPELVNFQGLLTDANGIPVADGSRSVTFRIYDAATLGTVQWQEKQSVSTEGGLFHVLLGSVTPLTAAAFSGTPRYLEVQVAADPPLTPRQNFVSVPYAFHADTADAANSAKSATNATTADKATLANDLTCVGCVDSGDIADGTITAGDLAADVVGGGVRIMRLDPGWKPFHRTNTNQIEYRSPLGLGTGIMQVGPFTAGSRFVFLVAQPQPAPGGKNCWWRLRRLSDDAILTEVRGPNDTNYRIIQLDSSAGAGTQVYLEVEDDASDGYCAWMPPIIIEN